MRGSIIIQKLRINATQENIRTRTIAYLLISHRYITEAVSLLNKNLERAFQILAAPKNNHRACFFIAPSQSLQNHQKS